MESENQSMRNCKITYGVEAIMLLREEVENYSPTKAKLVLIDEFCELNDKNYHFVSYVKLYFTTEEIIVARRKSWNAQMPAYTFSRAHKISDIVLKKERYLTDVIRIEDSSKDQTFYYQIHFSGDLDLWVVAHLRYLERYQNRKNKQSTTTSVAAASNCNEAKMVSGWCGSCVTSMELCNRVDCEFSARSNIVSSSQGLSSLPEPQEFSGFNLDNVLINEEVETGEEQKEVTSSSALEACNSIVDNVVIVSSYSSEEQVIPDDDMIHTLDMVACNMGHSCNESTSLPRGVEIMTQSESTISNAMSYSGANPATDSSMTVQAGLAYVLSDSNEDITARPLTPTTSVPTTNQEKETTMAAHRSALTPPKQNLVSKIFHHHTTSSISSDIDDSHTDIDTLETPRLFKKKLYQLDPKILSEQLALLNAEMLMNIKPDELTGGAWVGKNKETRAPNVVKMLKEFNRLAAVVPTEILEEKTPSGRAKVIACYIQIADKCHSIGNYNSLKAILAGLQCMPIYRLKKTWKQVNRRHKKKFEDLSYLMSEENNWKVYRAELRETMSKGACVPFLGQFLTQILHHEMMKELISYRRKSQRGRPQSGDLNVDNQQTLSAPTTPVTPLSSIHDDMDIISEAVSPTDLTLEQQTSTLSNTQLKVLIGEAKSKNNE